MAVRPEQYIHKLYPADAESIVHACFGSDHSEPLVNHKGKEGRGSFTPLEGVLVDAGCPPELIAQLLRQGHGRAPMWNHELITKFHSNPWTQTEQRIASVLRGATSVVLEAGQYSLDSVFVNGYNSHSSDHVSKVANRAVWLIHQSQFGDDEGTKRRTRVAGEMHDTFNILSRKLHQHGAIEFLRYFFPQFAEDPEQLSKVELAMHVHTESVAQQAFNMILAEVGNKDAAFFERLVKVLGPESLALIIADKTDIRPERSLNTKGLSVEALAEDPHILLNSIAKSIDFTFTAPPRLNGKRLVEWKLLFSPDLLKMFAPHIDVATLPATIIPNHGEWVGNFWNLYHDRIELVAKAVFSLYPDVSEFIITVENQVSDPEFEKSKKRHMKISRGNCHQDLQHWRDRYTLSAAVA